MNITTHTVSQGVLQQGLEICLNTGCIYVLIIILKLPELRELSEIETSKTLPGKDKKYGIRRLNQMPECY